MMRNKGSFKSISTEPDKIIGVKTYSKKELKEKLSNSKHHKI